MTELIQSDWSRRQKLEEASNSAMAMCWTCSSCDLECPVNIATGRLRPQKIVRMANLGMLDDLIREPEIWYCLTCRRCSQVCPNLVSPSTLIKYLRFDAHSRGIVSIQTIRRLQDVFTKFQRVRWHAVNRCFKAGLESLTDEVWQEWLEQPFQSNKGPVNPHAVSRFSSEVKQLMESSQTSACFTCGECCSACPTISDQHVFNPRTLFRMINLGLLDELIQSPSIWLCISCGRCTDSCSQLVDGRQLIEQVKDLAVQTGGVDAEFCLRVEHANQIIFKRLLDAIDEVIWP